VRAKLAATLHIDTSWALWCKAAPKEKDKRPQGACVSLNMQAAHGLRTAERNGALQMDVQSLTPWRQGALDKK